MGGGIPGRLPKKRLREGLSNGCFRKDTHTICTYTDEVSMLRAFSAYIVARDPDVLSGWNFVDFDMPYITGRMERLGLSSTHSPASRARPNAMPCEAGHSSIS